MAGEAPDRLAGRVPAGGARHGAAHAGFDLGVAHRTFSAR
jgi:hypothetical protein